MNVLIVICRYRNTSGQWSAWLDGTPSVAYGAELPMRAVSRLLDGSDIDHCLVVIHVDQVQAGSGVMIREALWKPPELLFLCSQCNGTGEYVGLTDRQKCQACEGRGWLVG